MELMYLKGGLKPPTFFKMYFKPRFTYPKIQVAWGTELCKVTLNIRVFSVWNLLPVNFLEPGILKWLLDA